jgi:hypothetical protein
MTGTAEASNPQVRTQIRASSQVAKSAPRTLSRWRHGFEPRWDYKREPAGQRHGAVAADALNGDSNRRYPANIPHEVVRNECAK